MGRVAQEGCEEIGAGVDGGRVERRRRRYVDAMRRAGSCEPIMVYFTSCRPCVSCRVTMRFVQAASWSLASVRADAGARRSRDRAIWRNVEAAIRVRAIGGPLFAAARATHAPLRGWPCDSSTHHVRASRAPHLVFALGSGQTNVGDHGPVSRAARSRATHRADEFPFARLGRCEPLRLREARNRMRASRASAEA